MYYKGKVYAGVTMKQQVEYYGVPRSKLDKIHHPITLKL
jgi:hypothetical protein